MDTKRVQKEWLSYDEAGGFASIGRTKLWELISAGEVRASRVGKAVRINRSSLEEYLERNPYVEESAADKAGE